MGNTSSKGSIVHCYISLPECISICLFLQCHIVLELDTSALNIVVLCDFELLEEHVCSFTRRHWTLGVVGWILRLHISPICHSLKYQYLWVNSITSHQWPNCAVVVHVSVLVFFFCCCCCCHLHLCLPCFLMFLCSLLAIAARQHLVQLKDWSCLEVWAAGSKINKQLKQKQHTKKNNAHPTRNISNHPNMA